MPPFVQVTPRRWFHRGEAEATLDGKDVLVWQGIPGERCVTRVLKEGANRDYLTWVRAEQPSPHRVAPPCRRYDLCGGCPLMHLDAAGQRAARRTLVRDALASEGQDDVSVAEVVPSPDGEEGFRWVVKLGIGLSDQGSLRVGAWGRRTRTVVPIPECNVAAAPLRRVMGVIAHHVRELEIRPYDTERDRGVLRAFVVRGSRATGEVLVTIVAGNRIRALQDLAEGIGTDPSVVGVALHLNDDPGNAIFTRDESGAVRTRTLVGRDHIEDVLDGIQYRIGPGDFFQTNPGMAEVLYRQTLDALELERGVPFIDLYCGVGGFALPAARRTGWALGVEEIEGAVESARAAARKAGVEAEFIAGRVATVLEDVRRRLAAVRPVIAVNPARRGLEDGVVEGILALRPRAVAYVSCNPKAMARDLALLRAGGLQPGPVALYDMFPHTSHTEAVVVLRAPDARTATGRAPRRRMVGKERES